MIRFMMRFFTPLYAADDGAGTGGGAGNGAGEEKIFKFKDPQTGKDIDLPEDIGGVNLKVLMGHVIGKTRKDTQADFEKRYEPLTQELEALRVKNTSLDEKLIQIQDSIDNEKLTAEQKAQKDAQRLIDKANKDKEAEAEKATGYFNKYKRNKIETDILRELGKLDLHDASQTLDLIMLRHKPDLKEINGEDRTIIAFNVDGVDTELSPGEVIPKILALPTYANHHKNNLRPGGGSSSSSGGRQTNSGTIEYTRAQLQDPKTREEYVKKMKEGQRVHIIE